MSKYILHTERENKQKSKNGRKELSYGLWNEFLKAFAKYYKKNEEIQKPHSQKQLSQSLTMQYSIGQLISVVKLLF